MKKMYKKIIVLIPFILVLLQLCYPFKALFSTFVQIPLFLLWLILILIDNPENIKILFKKNILILIFLFFILIRCILNLSFSLEFDSPYRLILNLYQIVVFYSITIFFINMDYANHFVKKMLLICILVSLMASNYLSIYYELFCHRHAIREALTDVYFGIGDFELIYANSIAIGVLLYSLLNFKKINLTNFLILLALISSLLIVYYSDFMIAIIIAAVSIFFALYFKLCKSIKPLIFILMVSLAVLIIFRESIGNLLLIIADKNILSTYMSMKIEYIANFLQGSGYTESLGDRISLMMRSLDTFSQNVLLGVDYSQFGFETLGLHTEWFDNLGYYGIIGFSVIIYIMINIYINIYLSFNDLVSKQLVKVSFLTFIVLGFSNPCMTGGIFCIVFLLPLVLDFSQSKNAISIRNNLKINDINLTKKVIDNRNLQKYDLTFIIPTYQRIDTIVDAINSILQQNKLDLNIELLVIDNGSDNFSLLATKLKNIRNLVLYQNVKNVGMFENMNRGIYFARGRYLSFLHDDDLLKDNYIEEISKVMEKNIDILISNYEYTGTKENPFPIKNIEKVINKILYFRKVYRPNYQEITNRNVLISRRNIYGPPSCGFLIKKNIMLDLGGFDASYYPSSDFEFFLRANRKYKIFRYNKVTSYYRWAENESLNPKTQDLFAYYNLLFYENIGKNSIFYKFFKNEIRYGIVKKSISSIYFKDHLEKNIKNNNFDYSKIKYYIYNIIRIFYFYINNLDTDIYN